MRVMTWNIHGMRGRDGRADPERVAAVIEEARVDLAALQEVGTLGGRGELLDPAGTLARLTGLAQAYGLTELRRGYPYGNCILSRFPIVATRSYDLSVPGREKRGCLRADVDLGASSLHVFNCHLGLDRRERRRQAAQLMSADILRDAALAYPLVLLGDFNAWSSRSAVPRWIRRQLSDAAVLARSTRPTFPAVWPLVRLDRAYVDSAVRVLGCRVHDSPLARLTSDHLPLVVTLALDPAARRPPRPRPITASGVTTTLGPSEPQRPDDAPSSALDHLSRARQHAQLEKATGRDGGDDG
jgi:endonuclease/exonuclease/phosphatase family metal-dependent hydrolase